MNRVATAITPHLGHSSEDLARQNRVVADLKRITPQDNGAAAGIAIADHPVCADTYRPLGDYDISSPYRRGIHWLHDQGVAILDCRQHASAAGPEMNGETVFKNCAQDRLKP